MHDIWLGLCSRPEGIFWADSILKSTQVHRFCRVCFREDKPMALGRRVGKKFNVIIRRKYSYKIATKSKLWTLSRCIRALAAL